LDSLIKTGLDLISHFKESSLRAFAGLRIIIKDVKDDLDGLSLKSIFDLLFFLGGV